MSVLISVKKKEPIIPGSLVISGILLGLLFFSLILSSVARAAESQPSLVDQTFQSGAGPNAAVVAIAPQPDGKILISGDFTTYNHTASSHLARLNTDGTVDTSFSPDPKAIISRVVLQNDGKILVGGAFKSYKGVASNNLARLNNAGSVDTTFIVAPELKGAVKELILQADGKFIVANQVDSYSAVVISRLNADGSLDNSFKVDPLAEVWAIAVQPDSKVLLSGNFSSYNGVASKNFVRLNADGSLDSSFRIGAGANSSIGVLTLQSDGKILIGGNFTSYNGIASHYLARLDTDGTLDTAFNANIGTNFRSNISKLKVQSDGKILVGGLSNIHKISTNAGIVRLNADGTLDTTFTPLEWSLGIVFRVELQADGKILVGGRFIAYNGSFYNHLIRLNADGTLDDSFNKIQGSGADSYVTAITIQPDEKILVGGAFNTYNGVVSPNLVRLNPDGTLDSSFKVKFDKRVGTSVSRLVVQSDGKILISGKFKIPSNTSESYFARLNADGTLDTAFSKNSSFDAYARSIAAQSDGKILVGGEFKKYNGEPASGIVRLNPDGTLDSSFKVGSGVDMPVEDLILLHDGKILLAGWFKTYNATPVKNLIRLNSDGTLDSSFNAGGNINISIYEMFELQDGKIMLGLPDDGTYNGAPRKYIARLNADGTLDTSFKYANLNYFVHTFSEQADGKILVGGTFTSYADLERIGLARLNADGTLDTSFKINLSLYEPTEPNNQAAASVYALAVQPDGKILIGGNFDTVDGSTRNFIARLLPGNAPAVGLTSHPNPTNLGDTITFTASVTPSTAIGTAQFRFSKGDTISFTVTSNLVGGVASYVTNTLEAGSYKVVASYSGDKEYSASNSAEYTQRIVLPCNPELKIAPNCPTASNLILFQMVNFVRVFLAAY